MKDPKDLISIEILPFGEVYKACRKSTLLETLLEAEIPINHSCGGMGSCGTCQIVIDPAGPQPDPRNELEQEMATERGFTSRERLSCQIEPQDGLRITIPYLPRKMD